MEDGENSTPDPSETESGSFVPPDMEAMGDALDEYEIIGKLGQGGMGAVYEGRQKNIGRPVAIKILPKGEADEDLRFQERFQREVHVMAQMAHPNIVTVYNFGKTADDQLFFVMEYVKGSDLSHIIHQGDVSLDRIYKWIEQICDALFYAHSMGVIHRDIKPANILITENDDVKIADFGLAKLTGGGITDELTRLTMTNMAMGTPDYVAPEALKQGATVDHRADIYAIGVMMYEMLTGEIPRGAWKPPSGLIRQLDPRWDEIVVKAMEPDQEHRFHDALEVSKSVAQIRDQRPEAAPAKKKTNLVVGSAAMRKMDAEPAGDAANQVVPQPGPAKKRATTQRKAASKPKEKNPISIVIGVLAAAVLVMGVMILMKKRGEVPAPEGSRDHIAVSPEPVNYNPDSPHRKAAQWILAGGGGTVGIKTGDGEELEVTSADQLPNQDFELFYVLLHSRKLTNDELSVFEGVDSLVHFRFLDMPVNDQGLANLGGSRDIAAIEIRGSVVTGSGLEKYVSLTNLSSFLAKSSSFSDVGMKYLARSNQLKTVDLSDTQITDDGLALLSGKGTIQSLLIEDTAVSSKGIDNLRGMTGLKRLSVSGCARISEQSLRAFLEAHPNCKIVSEKSAPGEEENNITHLKGHTDAITHILMLPDGYRVLTNSKDKTLRLWDLRENEEIWKHGKRGLDYMGIALSSDGKTIAASIGNAIELISTGNAELLRKIKVPNGMYPKSLAFSKDGKKLIAGGASNPGWRVQVYSLDEKSDDPVFDIDGPKGMFISSVDFHPVEEKFVVAQFGFGMNARVYEMGNPEPVYVFPGTKNGHTISAEFMEDGTTLLIGRSGAILVHDMEKKMPTQPFPTKDGRSFDAFADNRYLAAGDKNGKKIVIYEIRGKKILAEKNVDGYAFNSLAASNREGVVVFGGGSSKDDAGLSGRYDLHVWKIPDLGGSEKAGVSRGSKAQNKLMGHTGPITGVEILPGEIPVVVSISGADKTGDRTIRWWDLEAGKETNRKNNIVAHSFQLSPDGKSLLTANWVGAVLFDSATGNIINRFSHGEMGVRAAEFSPDGKQIAIGGAKGHVAVFNIGSSEPMWEMKPGYDQYVTSLAFLRGTNRIAVSYGHIDNVDPLPARVFTIGENEVAYDIEISNGFVPRLSTSVDGKYLLAARAGVPPELFDAKTGKNIRTYQGLKKLTGQAPFVLGLGFFHKDRYIYAGTGDGQIGIWETETGKLMHLYELGEPVTGHLAVSVQHGIIICGGNLMSEGSDYTLRILPLPDGLRLD